MLFNISKNKKDSRVKTVTYERRKSFTLFHKYSIIESNSNRYSPKTTSSLFTMSIKIFFGGKNMMEYMLQFLGVVLYPFMLVAIIYELYMIRLTIERKIK